MIPQFSLCIPAYRNPATLEVCLAIMASGRDGKVRRLKHQVPAP